ncbi:MAG: hypothetical protein HQ517_04555, partial [SAR324 cluster bacterium]|nr:hypothetical protein [SAR324 cluster bacterium]
MRDCIFLLADANMKAAFEGFLCREQFHRSLGCGSFGFNANLDLKVAAGDCDPGLYTRGHELLRPFLNTHAHAIIVLDAEWEGSPGAAEIVEHVTMHLLLSGWKENNSKVIVIDPELENWIWQRNIHVATALGLNSSNDFSSLIKEDIWPDGQAKPNRPKETLEGVLESKRIPRSSSIYKKITSRVSVRGCKDGAFHELLILLK